MQEYFIQLLAQSIQRLLGKVVKPNSDRHGETDTPDMDDNLYNSAYGEQKTILSKLFAE